MSYPFSSRAETRSYLAALSEDYDDSDVVIARPEVHLNPEGDDLDWDEIGESIQVTLENLIASLGVDGKKGGSAFEASAAPLIHRLLPEHPALADPDFWIWLVIRHGREIVRWRYGDIKNMSNFGVGGAGENLFYRLWLRAEIAYAPGSDDPYRLAQYGDIDFWRSHLFRQSYGDARVFARALLEFQFPASLNGKARLKIIQIRSLAKHLKRARSNLLFEVMSEQRATQFIEKEWDRLLSESA